MTMHYTHSIYMDKNNLTCYKSLWSSKKVKGQKG